MNPIGSNAILVSIIIYCFYFAISFTQPITGTTDYKPFRIDLQTATVYELELLPGVGPKTATKIIEYRKEHGLKSPDDLTGVYGIGQLTVDRLRYLIKKDEDAQ